MELQIITEGDDWYVAQVIYQKTVYYIVSWQSDEANAPTWSVEASRQITQQQVERVYLGQCDALEQAIQRAVHAIENQR